MFVLAFQPSGSSDLTNGDFGIQFFSFAPDHAFILSAVRSSEPVARMSMVCEIMHETFISIVNQQLNWWDTIKM